MGGGKAKEMMGGGKMMKGMMDYAMGGKMDKDMMKMYATGGMLEALMKDPKQREMAKKMLGSMEKGGMMYGEKGMKVKKYQEGGMNATGETGRSKLQDFRDERRAIAEERAARIAGAKERNEEFQEQYRKRRRKQAKKDRSGLSFKSAGEAVINSPFHSRSQEQERNDYRLQKRLAGMGVDGLIELFKSEDYGNFVKPNKKQIEKFVAEYSKK